MDRDRLKEVHKTDTTESRVNEDFVDWLKTKGPTWLLVVLIALTVYLGSVRWRESREAAHINAWRALADAELSAMPTSYEVVAEDHPDVDGIAKIARLSAAERLLLAVQQNRPLSADPEAPQTLSDDDREQYLSRADRLYQAVLDADSGSRDMTIHAVKAFNGRAAVAEARGDADAARRHYLAAADRAASHYPHLANQARQRAEDVEQNIVAVTLPSDEEVEASRRVPGSQDLRPAGIEPALRDLVLPQ